MMDSLFFWQLVLEKRDYNTAGAMSMFHKPIVDPDYVKEHRNIVDAHPGPGYYNQVLDSLDTKPWLFFDMTSHKQVPNIARLTLEGRGVMHNVVACRGAVWTAGGSAAAELRQAGAVQHLCRSPQLLSRFPAGKSKGWLFTSNQSPGKLKVGSGGGLVHSKRSKERRH
jgi:hypothetical protein